MLRTSVERIKKRQSKDKELGVSLVEVLVYIALFTVLTVIVLSVINTTISSSQRITSSSTTQAKMSQAASLMQREISLANTVTFATPNRLDFTLRQEGNNQKTSIFTYIPGSGTNSFPAGVTINDMPAYNAVIRVVTLNGGTPSVSVLIEGYNSDAFGGHGLFTYFDRANDELVLGDASVQTARDQVARIEFHLAANSDGRNTALQIESSAVPIFDSPPGVMTSENTPLIPECAANFSSTITPRSTYATLNWNAPTGAVSYTIYRYNMSESGQLEGSTLIPDPGVTSLSNSGVTAGLAWGTTYRFTIQISGAGGITSECSDTTSTVVPDTTGIVNINPFATNLTSINPSGTLNMSFPTNGGEAVQTQTTDSLTDGYRYTVARGLINQLAWDSQYGATTYSIYVSGSPTPFATISNGNTYFQDTTNSRVDYGLATTYRVSASNAGGEGVLSDPIQLISPPAAPQMLSPVTGATAGTDPVRPDSSRTLRGVTYSPTSTTTLNSLQLQTPSANTVAYRAYAYRGNTAATTQCNALSYQSNLNFVTTGAIDAGTPWGSYDCYAYSAVNAAGVGPQSTPVEIKQYPGPFALTGSVTSEPYNFLDLTQPNWPGGVCWAVRSGAYQGYSHGYDRSCSGAYSPNGQSSADPQPNGMFNKVADKYTSVWVSWGRSLNATGGYDVSRNVLSVKCVDPGTGAVTTNISKCPYQGTANHNFYYTNDSAVTGIMRYEMPGAAFDYTVAAKSAAGVLREKTGNRILTQPDIPSQGQTHYERNGTWRRIVLTTLASVRLGNSTSITVQSGATGQTKGGTSFNGQSFYSYTANTLADIRNNGTYLCGGGATSKGCVGPQYQNTYSVNANYRTFQSNWTYDGSTVKSRVIAATGYMTGPVSDSGVYYWQQYPDYWPMWSTGAHQGWWSGSQSHAPLVEYNAGALVPPSDPLVSNESGGLDCSTTYEDDPDFTTGCVTGTGIPLPPANVATTGSSYNSGTANTTYTVSWDAVPGADSYSYQLGADAPVSVTTTSVDVVIPTGSTLQFEVNATNLNNTSDNSAPIQLQSQTIGAVTLTKGLVTSTTVNLSWTSTPSATSYEVWRSIDDGSFVLINTTTSPSFANNWVQSQGKKYQFYVIAKNSGMSSTSNTVIALGTLATPTLNPPIVTTPGMLDLSWSAVSSATGYEIWTRDNSGIWVLETTTGNVTNTSIAWNPTPLNPSIDVRIRAVNNYATSPWSSTQSTSI